jgi:hypothetical protein
VSKILPYVSPSSNFSSSFFDYLPKSLVICSSESVRYLVTILFADLLIVKSISFAIS